jgi:hypothetical protein
MRAVLCAPGALAAAVADEGERRELTVQLGLLGAPAERAVQVLRAWKAKDPAHAVGLARGAAREEYAAAAVALAMTLLDGSVTVTVGCRPVGVTITVIV